MDFKQWLRNEEDTIPITMHRTPSQNTTTQNIWQKVIDYSAANTLATPEQQEKNWRINYHDLIPTMWQQSADSVEFRIPFQSKNPNAKSSEINKELLATIEEMPQVVAFIKRGQLDPQSIVMHDTGVVDGKTKKPVFHVRFPIAPPNSIRLPTYGVQRTKYI